MVQPHCVGAQTVITLFDDYPMPRLDELINRLGKAFRTLELTKGYWLVPLATSYRKKMAFLTPDALYPYRVLPFGLHGAPPMFQHLMDRDRQPHQQYAAVYLDDIIIHSQGWEEHLMRLQALLDTLRQARLTANPKKCKLVFEEVEYLGYLIGCGNVKLQERKVQAVCD